MTAVEHGLCLVDREGRVIGAVGVVLAGGFLDNRITGLGTYGTLLSAGAIPMIYVLIGLKVGSELSALLERFSKTE